MRKESKRSWLRHVIASFCACALLSGCLTDPTSPDSSDVYGVWYEETFGRAFSLDADGGVVCVGTRCGEIEDTLGSGAWEKSGSQLTLAGLSGELWWPGGSGLAPGAVAVFEYELSSTSLTLVPTGGSAIVYSRTDPTADDVCTPADTNLQLLFPRGGEVFTTGEVIRIRWRASGLIASVVVDFSSDAGKSYWNICGRAVPTRDSTWFDWAVEPFDDPAPECYMRVFDYANNELGFSSSGAFVVE